MKRSNILTSFLLISLVSAGIAASADALTFGGGEKHAFTEDFFVEQCTFSSVGSNTYFIIQPGYQLVLEGVEDKEEVRAEITVLKDEEDGIEIVMFNGMEIETRVVEEREEVDGELAEVSLNYFALCIETGNVFYFGEDVEIYEDGVVVSSEGAWRAGVDGAVPGVIMPGSPMLGARFFQEMAPGVAMDRAEVIRLDAVVETPFDEFERCLETKETSPINPSDKETKFHAPGVGVVVDGPLSLTEINML